MASWRADPFEGGVEPQGDGQSGVEGGATGPSLAGAERVGEGGDIEPAAKVPDDAGLVVVVEESVEGHGVENAGAIRGPQARRGQGFGHDRSSNGVRRHNRWSDQLTQ